MIGATAPDVVELFIEVGGAFWVNNETGFCVATLDDLMKEVSGDIASGCASDCDNTEILSRIAVIGFEKFCLNLLNFWFN